jgi:hypothetical protein
MKEQSSLFLEEVGPYFSLICATACLAYMLIPITTQVWPRVFTIFGYLFDKVGWDCCTVWLFSHSRELNCPLESACQYQFSFFLSLNPFQTVSFEYFWSSILPPTSYTSLCHLILTYFLNHLPLPLAQLGLGSLTCNEFRASIFDCWGCQWHQERAPGFSIPCRFRDSSTVRASLYFSPTWRTKCLHRFVAWLLVA